MVLGSFVINTFLSLVSMSLCYWATKTSANYYIFFLNVYSHGAFELLKNFPFGYLFVLLVVENGQTITFSRCLFMLDFYHRNSSALSVSYHKKACESECKSKPFLESFQVQQYGGTVILKFL